ncbi:MAG: hypothetical protein ACTSX9_02515 [Candidatus Njordarchaeales archaeon]
MVPWRFAPREGENVGPGRGLRKSQLAERMLSESLEAYSSATMHARSAPSTRPAIAPRRKPSQPAPA